MLISISYDLLFLFLLVMGSLAHSAGLFFWCTLKYTPQALHTGEPMLSFLHVEVVVVKQLEQLSKGVMEKFGVEGHCFRMTYFLS